MAGLTKFQRIGARAIREIMTENRKKGSMALFSLSSAADKAAREAGKVRDIFENLDSYIRLLPPGSTTRWEDYELGSILKATNPFAATEAVETFNPATGPAGVYDAAIDLGPQVAARLA